PTRLEERCKIDLRLQQSCLCAGRLASSVGQETIGNVGALGQRKAQQTPSNLRSNQCMPLGPTPVCVILEPMIDESLRAKVTSLSTADRLEFIAAVWDTLSPDDLPVTEAERLLLDARLADIENSPDDQSPWPEAKARLERLLR